MTRQQTTRKARQEAKNELNTAVAMRAERGTIVLSTGGWVAFTIRYVTLQSGVEMPFIRIANEPEWPGVNDAASTVLSRLGYTR